MTVDLTVVLERNKFMQRGHLVVPAGGNLCCPGSNTEKLGNILSELHILEELRVISIVF